MDSIEKDDQKIYEWLHPDTGEVIDEPVYDEKGMARFRMKPGHHIWELTVQSVYCPLLISPVVVKK